MSTFQSTCSRRSLLAAMLWASATGAWAVPDGTELMKLNFLATKVAGFSGKVTMTLVNQRSEQRVRVMSVKSRLRGNGIDSAVLTGFLQPGDIKGTGFLQIENSAGNDDIWVYLPALSKTRRLAANNKRDSFFGTDFSYGDILLPPVSAYGHTWLRTDTIDGVAYNVVESKPLDSKTRDDTGYGRRVTWLDPRNQVEHKVEYYDVADKLLKTQLVSDLRELDTQNHRWLAMRREMVNHQTGHKTLYVFEEAAFMANLSDTDFSVRELEAQ